MFDLAVLAVDRLGRTYPISEIFDNCRFAETLSGVEQAKSSNPPLHLVDTSQKNQLGDYFKVCFLHFVREIGIQLTFPYSIRPLQTASCWRDRRLFGVLSVLSSQSLEPCSRLNASEAHVMASITPRVILTLLFWYDTSLGPSSLF